MELLRLPVLTMAYEPNLEDRDGDTNDDGELEPAGRPMGVREGGK